MNHDDARCTHEMLAVQTCAENFTIAIVGLGLIGGSLAYDLKDFQNAKIIGIDRCPATREKAMQCGAVDVASQDPAAIADADLVIFCLYPEQIVHFVQHNAGCFKRGAVITDVCSVKMQLVQRIQPLLPDYVDYVPCHPMAGKQSSGFDNAQKGLFRGAGFAITPLGDASGRGVALLHSIARHVGAGEIVCVTPQKHDEIVAYTSHLCHVSAVALCLGHAADSETRALTGGSFRDCTRVADINCELWSSLLMQNRQPLLREIAQYLKSLTELQDALQRCDVASLRGLLKDAGEYKREMSGL